MEPNPPVATTPQTAPQANTNPTVVTSPTPWSFAMMSLMFLLTLLGYIYFDPAKKQDRWFVSQICGVASGIYLLTGFLLVGSSSNSFFMIYTCLSSI